MLLPGALLFRKKKRRDKLIDKTISFFYDYVAPHQQAVFFYANFGPIV